MPVMTKEQFAQLVNLMGAVVRTHTNPGDKSIQAYLNEYQIAEDMLCKDPT